MPSEISPAPIAGRSSLIPPSTPKTRTAPSVYTPQDPWKPSNPEADEAYLCRRTRYTIRRPCRQAIPTTLGLSRIMARRTHLPSPSGQRASYTTPSILRPGSKPFRVHDHPRPQGPRVQCTAHLSPLPDSLSLNSGLPASHISSTRGGRLLEATLAHRSFEPPSTNFYYELTRWTILLLGIPSPPNCFLLLLGLLFYSMYLHMYW